MRCRNTWPCNEPQPWPNPPRLTAASWRDAHPPRHPLHNAAPPAPRPAVAAPQRNAATFCASPQPSARGVTAPSAWRGTPDAAPAAANVTKREDFEPRRLRSAANVTKREVFQRRTPERGARGGLRRCGSWAFVGDAPAWQGPGRRKLRVLLHLQHGDGPAGPKLRVLLHLHQGPRRAGRVAGAWPVGRG